MPEASDDPYTALSLFCDATGALAPTDGRRFCELVHKRGFAIVRLPACAHAEALAVREAAGSFFAMEKEQKREVGDFRVVGDTYVGYRDTAATRQDCDAEFLEVHLDSSGRAFPDPRDCRIGPVAQALFVRLAGIARDLLQLLASHVDVPPAAFLAPMDPVHAAELPEGALTASVLRLCHYRARPGASAEAAAEGPPAASETATSADGGGGGGGGEGEGEGEGEGGEGGGGPQNEPGQAARRDGRPEVLFDEHTDSSLLTLSLLCPGAAGLELRDPLAAEAEGGEPGWLSCLKTASTLLEDSAPSAGQVLPRALWRSYEPQSAPSEACRGVRRPSPRAPKMRMLHLRPPGGSPWSGCRASRRTTSRCTSAPPLVERALAPCWRQRPIRPPGAS